MNERYTTAKKVTLLGALLNVLLGVGKLLGGFIFHSHALIADGLHSFSDLLIDGMVLFASKYGSEQADTSHPYGHQRIETAATFFLALILVITGLAISWDSIHELIHNQHDTPTLWALPVALTSILINEALFYYTRHIGHKIKSDLLITNAWHHRSDAASSLVVLAGIIGSLLGFSFLDAVAAIVVGVLIIHMGLTYAWESIKELVDTAVSEEQLKEIESVIHQIQGVKKIHQLRTRTMGRDIYIDVHVMVSPFISVSEGHFIAQTVHHQLIQQVSHVKDVTVHIDPEDDETAMPSNHLPNRDQLEAQLIQPWKIAYPEISAWIIHYIDGEITLDLICATTININHFQQQSVQDLQNLEYPLRIRIYIDGTQTSC